MPIPGQTSSQRGQSAKARDAGTRSIRKHAQSAEAEIDIIDSHHHLWDSTDPRYYILDNGGAERFWGNFSEVDARYLVNEYLHDFAPIGVRKAVHVSAGFDPHDPVAETRLLQRMAQTPASQGFPHAIVGWVDLSSPMAEAVLEEHADHANFRGVRQMLNRHEVALLTFARRDYLSDDLWRRNFALLRNHGLSFDLSINPGQMMQAAEFARAHSDTPLALCHLGFPIERYGQGIERWRAGMRALAECQNVFVKMSGMGMFDRYWTSDTIRRIVLETLDLFGVERTMFGSNFPIDKLMMSASGLKTALVDVVSHLSTSDKDRLFYGTAAQFYRI